MTAITAERLEAYIALGENLESHGVTLEDLRLLSTTPYREKVGISIKEIAIDAQRAAQRASAKPMYFTPPTDPMLNVRFIHELNLPPGYEETLRRQHICTLEDLTSLTANELMNRTGFSSAAILPIMDRLEQRRLSLEAEEPALH